MEVQEEEEEETQCLPLVAAGEERSMEVDQTEEVQAEEVQAEEVQGSSERVECPICMRPFPLPQIEVHAAYCDGTAQLSGPEESNTQGLCHYSTIHWNNYSIVQYTGIITV